MRYYPNIKDRPDLPDDAYGPEELLQRIQATFDELVEMIGYDPADQELAEIALRARPRRYHHV